MKSKVLAIVGAILVVCIVIYNPFEPKGGGFAEVLYNLSESQEQLSDTITSEAVSGLEGNLVGEHQVKGSNWSIPNILRYWIGEWFT